MKTPPAEAKARKSGKPFEVVKAGSVSVPFYRQKNIIPQRDAAGKIVYCSPRADGKPQALVKYQSDIFTVAYYEGRRRIRRKFSDLTQARNEAGIAAIKLANGESEALKLQGHDRTDYVRAMQKLREWKPAADLNLAVTDYVAAARRLPEHTSLKEAVDVYLKRHPIGLPQKTVQEVVDELVDAKEKAGKSEIYTRKMRQCLGHFANAFNIRLSLVTGKQVED